MSQNIKKSFVTNSKQTTYNAVPGTVGGELNAQQLEVVRTIDGPVLVVAGAGSGKTRVIEYRVLHFIQSGIQPENILLLTFTKKAAQQMLSRASRHDVRCGLVHGGTFHSFAYRILKKYSVQSGLGEFFIIDESDAEEAINICSAKFDTNGKDKRFPRKDTLRKVFSMVVNKNMSVEDILDKEYPQFLKYSFQVEAISQEYKKYKKSKGYLDYDDLLVYLRNLLEKNNDIRKELSEQYKYIMVDEYQDTNKLQSDITYFLARDHKNIMIVGDDAQSIYGFRGASHENIMDFPERFPGCKIIKLETNYRSHQPILDVANAVLKNMKNKYSKELYSYNKEHGDRPELLFFTNTNAEAGWMARKVKSMAAEGMDLKYQAVLFRYAYISIPLQLELNRLRIPFQLFGGMKFYETAHVKDVLAYLKALVNFKDELSWLRMLTLLEGIGPKTASGIVKDINNANNFDEAVKSILCSANRKKSYSTALFELVNFLKTAQAAEGSVSEQFEALLEYYNPIMQYKFDDARDRMNDLKVIKRISADYKSTPDFLADFALDSPDKGAFSGHENMLTLSTIHSAKGLEWDVVFLMGLVEGVLPVSFSLDDEDSIEEEHRLFYVGITRAKKHLFLCAHYEGTMMGQSQFNRISRFVDSENVLSKVKQEAVY